MPKVLIIDDEPLMQEVYKKGLEKSSFEVLQAWDGQSGIEEAINQNPDVILLDLMMPKMDGLTALRKLKRNEKTNKIPVMIITNFGQEEKIRKALDLEVTDFILKYRITAEEVGEKINQVLKPR